MGKDSESLSLIFSPVTLVKLKIRNSNLTGMLWGLPYEYIACTQNMLILSLLFLDILKHEVSDVNYMFIIECMERAVKQKKRKIVTIDLPSYITHGVPSLFSQSQGADSFSAPPHSPPGLAKTPRQQQWGKAKGM